jgi:endonuclease/exonuclease/phosphatase family metal-dependent hydrolase
MTFPDFACAGFDCLANKGVLIAHLHVPGSNQPVSIVNTHLNARKAAGVPVARTQHAFARQVELMARFVAEHVPAGRPMILGGDMNIGKDRQRAEMFFAQFARARLGFVSPGLSGARRALAASACPDAATRRDLIRASQHAKDWLFARDASHAPMPFATAHVPFGTEADGIALSDHIGYVIDYSPAAPLRVACARSGGAML